MPKTRKNNVAASSSVLAFDGGGKSRPVQATRLEISLPGGRLVLDLTHRDRGEVLVSTSGEAGAPQLTLQPGGAHAFALGLQAAGAVAPLAAGAVEVAVPRLEMSVQKALQGADAKAYRPRKAQVQRWAAAALQHDAVVTVRFVGEEEGLQLNRDYRGKDYATNVLTFVYGDDDLPAEAAAPLMGDLVLCVPVVLREAQAQGVTPEAHYAHLIVHGMLHLQGYDHETDAEAEEMEALEARVLASLGYADPYAAER